MKKGILVFCINTDVYRYDKIAAKTIPLLKKNLGLPVTVVTNFDTYKMLPPLGFVDYKLIDNQTGNFINNKPWHNLDRHRAYELSPYDKTLLVDIDFFCYSDNLLTLFDTDHDFLVHDQVHDVTGKDSYNFRRNSSIPMVWATLIFFKKTALAKSIFDMVAHIKKNYQFYCNLYRIDFPNFRNDYAFAIALQQIHGFVGYPVMPTKLATLPANAKVTSLDDQGMTWTVEDRHGRIEHTDVHVIDKGVAYV
jgi:hypothetical protein